MKTQREKNRIRIALGGILLAAFCVLTTGCVTTEEVSTADSRPWNSPKGWESGLPVSLTEGR
ncbi:MAG: hypothetical protein ACI9VS_001539 [Candidatus Binatia bacterium]|jgi:hypothetical protein